MLLFTRSLHTGVTSDDSISPDCTFDCIVGGKSLELYEVDLPTKMSVVMDYDEDSITTLKIGLRMIEVFNRYVMGTPIVTENYVKSESGFEESPALTAAELNTLYASATKIGTPIPFQITNPVKEEPYDRSRRFTQNMQDLFEESLSQSPSVEEVVPVLANTPVLTEETSPSPDSSSEDEETVGGELEFSLIFDRELHTWDNTESYTLKVLRESINPF